MINMLLLTDLGIGILIIALAIPMILEKVKPNPIYGFRTKKTLSDEKIWYPANKYSGKAMILAGLFLASASAGVMALNMKFNLLTEHQPAAVMAIWGIFTMTPILVMTVASIIHLRKY